MQRAWCPRQPLLSVIADKRANVEKRGLPALSAMGRDLLVRNAFDWALFGPNRRTRQSLHHSARAFRIGDPFLIEVIWTNSLASHVFPRIDLARVSAVHKLEQM